MQAALGGNPSKLGQVHAFLRVKNQDVSTTLDFDSPTGTDTSWQRIFCCLRSGFSAEALEVSFCHHMVRLGIHGHKEWLSPAVSMALSALFHSSSHQKRIRCCLSVLT